MNLDFPFILTTALLVSAVISLIDKLMLARFRSHAKLPWLAEYARSFFMPLLIVWLVRSFLFSPFIVPTGSLEPTVIPGDFTVVDHFSYGLRLPVWHKKLLDVGSPQVGDIAVFRWLLTLK